MLLDYVLNLLCPIPQNVHIPSLVIQTLNCSPKKNQTNSHDQSFFCYFIPSGWISNNFWQKASCFVSINRHQVLYINQVLKMFWSQMCMWSPFIDANPSVKVWTFIHILGFGEQWYVSQVGYKEMLHNFKEKTVNQAPQPATC